MTGGPSKNAGAVKEGPGLGDRAVSGVLWSTVQRWVARIGGVLTVIILARLLMPADFGLVAVAMSFVPVIYLISDLGFSTYIVQTDDISPRVLSTAFWYALAAGAALCGGLILLSPLIGIAFGAPGVVPVLYGISPSVLLVALSSVPISLMRRRMAFRTLAMQSVIAGVVSQAAAIIVALLGYGVWALVVQLVLNQLIVTVLAWTFSRYRPLLSFSRSHFAEMFRFGSSVIGVEFIALARLWAETAIITMVLGVTGLGYLNIAQRLVQTTQDLSAAAVLPVSTVVFAQLKSSRERLASTYRRATETVFLAITPVMIGVAIGTPLLIPLMFGKQWDTSIAPAQALTIAGIFTMGAMLDNGLFYATGNPGRWLVYAILVDGLTVATTAICVHAGLLAVTLGFVGVAIVATIVRWFMVSRVLRSGISVTVMPFFAAVAAGIPAAAAGMGVLYLTQGLNSVLALFLLGISILAVFAGAARVFLPRAFQDCIRLVRDRIHRSHGLSTAADAGIRLPKESSGTT